jgi:hypothetical protein
MLWRGDIATPIANNGYPVQKGTKTNLGKLFQKKRKLILSCIIQDQ